MKKYIIDKLPGDIIGKIVLSDFLSPPPDDTNEVIIGVTVIMDQVFRQDDVKILEFLDHVPTIYMVGDICDEDASFLQSRMPYSHYYNI